MNRFFSSTSNLFLFAFILITLSSCGSLKDIAYFQKAETQYIPTDNLSRHEVRIASSDNLMIAVFSSTNQRATDIFNSMKSDRSVTDNVLKWQGYLVDETGSVNFPLIGKVHLAGLTKSEAVKFLQDKISVYIEDPVVNIRFMNYKVTIMGEVNRPGAYYVDDEKLTIIQALGLSGDLTIYGNRRNILVCREISGQMQFHRVDITSPNIFNSPVFYLQQNDYVYIEPNKAKARNSTYNQNLPIVISVASLLMTAIALFVRR